MQDIETRLFKDPDWPNLSRKQRKRFAEHAEMEELEARMRILHTQNRKALRALPRLAAATPRALVRKLEVALCEVNPHDNADAHRLIKSILRDFKVLYGD